MPEDSINKTSGVEVVEARKRKLLRPIAIRGDSFVVERDEGGNSDNDYARKPSISSARSRPPPTPRSATYQPDWAQDAENMHMPPVAEDELGSPEDLKDVLRMGIVQEMRVSSSSRKSWGNHDANVF